MPVEVIPGPSACVTALVSSGIPCEHFFFEGFLGRKHGDRVRRLQRLAVVPGALIFYESPHRIVATLEAVAEVFPQREVAVCRELTKLHEEVLRGPADQLAEELRARGEVKGEIALVIAPPSEDEEAGIVPVGATAADPDEALRRLSCENEAATDDLKGICAWGLLAGGQPVEKGDPLFPRLA